MQTFDQALYELYGQCEISYEDALANAYSKNDLRLIIKLHSQGDDLEDATSGLSIEGEKKKTSLYGDWIRLDFPATAPVSDRRQSHQLVFYDSRRRGPTHWP